MIKLIDKTPKNVFFDEGYKRINPIYLNLEKGYEVIGVDLANKKPCIYMHGAVNHGPEVFLTEFNKRFYAGTLSISGFYPPESLRSSILEKQKRLPIPLSVRAVYPLTYIKKRVGILKSESLKLQNILRTSVFRDRFKEDYGELDFEEAIYAPEKRILVKGKEINIGFDEWEMKMNYFLNHFMAKNREENIEALIAGEYICLLDNKDIIQFNPGFMLQFNS